MKYKFSENTEAGYSLIPVTDFRIIDKKYEHSYLDHLADISGSYLREIMKNLERVRNNSLDKYIF